MPKLTKKELLTKLKALQGDYDVEVQHGDADDLLIEFIGDKDIEREYDKVPKWYA